MSIFVSIWLIMYILARVLFYLPTYLKVAIIIAMFKQTKRRYDLNSGGDILFVLKVERRVHINFSFVSIVNTSKSSR